jgi:hypothetical protein
LGYIVLGYTQGRSSVEVIGRYKTPDEMRDILRGDERAARRASKKEWLYVFEECRSGEVCLYLVTFDIKLVQAKTPRATRLLRKPAKEYTRIKEFLFGELCGSVDMSTYVCTENLAGEVERMLREFRATRYRVAYYRVRPWDDRARELVRESVGATLDWLMARTYTLGSKLYNVAPKGYGRFRKVVLEFLEVLEEAREKARRVENVLRAVGVELNVAERVAYLERQLREAIQRREESRAGLTGRKAEE